MSHTVDLDENRSVRVADQTVETHPPDRIEFAAEGTISLTDALLDRFAGATLRPVRIEVAVDDSPPVDVDLTEAASLRLETVDVGVETPDADDLSVGMESIGASTEDAESSGPTAGAAAFTVEGVVRDVPDEEFGTIRDGSPSLKSVTFGLEGPLESDGGSEDDESADDVVLRLTLLGYGVVVRRDGTIDVGLHGGVIDLDLG